MSEPALPMPYDPARPATRADDFDVRRLLDARLHDPRRVLGMHPLGRDNVVIRAILPYAVAAELVEPSATLARVGSTPLFEWVGPRSSVGDVYRLRWQTGHGDWIERYDPYCFPLALDEAELARFGCGAHHHSYRLLGPRHTTLLGVPGVLFGVWAPNAERVSLIGDFNGWDGRCHPMTVRGHSGVWELFMPELAVGELYKFEIRHRDSGGILVKIDPYARGFEHRPATASVVEPESGFEWRDGEWLSSRAAKDWHHEPISIYEVHLGSWRRGGQGEFLNYRDLARYLAPYAADLGFTHVELMPITEHPLDDSWGYQCTGYFAPTRRHGSADDFREFVSILHEHGVGVILDWVPGHFPRDGHALARFDGTNLFEYGDTRKGEHPDWGTLVFDYARSEVQSFLLSSAIYWLEEFHCDGLRVDAVASMIYLDYSRRDGEWAPNAYGGNENLEALAFLKRLNELTHGVCPGTLTFAEESTAWPQVSHPTYAGGLGFSFKWNMGWMHDTLVYASKDAIHRRYHHNLLTFGPIYAFTENFVLPLSHDEVVHGKRSLLDKMPGDDWQRFANLRLLLSYQWTYPGKKLLFMGGEFAQPWEWNARESLPWHIADEPARAGVTALVRDLNRLYRTLPALHRGDHDAHGFAWLSWQDDENSVLSFLRRHGDDHVVVLLNFTPVPRPGYRVGVPHRGRYDVLMNSDSRHYGGSNWPASGTHAEPVPCMGHGQSIMVDLPPLGALVLAPKR